MFVWHHVQTPFEYTINIFAGKCVIIDGKDHLRNVDQNIYSDSEKARNCSVLHLVLMNKNKRGLELCKLVDEALKSPDFNSLEITVKHRERYQRLKKRQCLIVSCSGHYARKGQGPGKRIRQEGHNQGLYGIMVCFRPLVIDKLLGVVGKSSDTITVTQLGQKDSPSDETIFSGTRLKASFSKCYKKEISRVIQEEIGQWWPKGEPLVVADPLVIWCQGNAPRQQDHIDGQFQGSLNSLPAFSSLLINLTNVTQYLYFGGDKQERKINIYPHCALLFADQAHHAGCEGQHGLLHLHARLNKIGQGRKSRKI